MLMPPTQATKELMNSANYFVNVQLTKFILTCLDLLAFSLLHDYDYYKPRLYICSYVFLFMLLQYQTYS